MESIVDNVDVERNCDQATNEMSSVDKTPQTNQNSTETGGKTGEEDEDEDRNSNHLYPYNSINYSHNHNGNDDDDDCNSSEDTKTSCPGECVSLMAEQHNGQQQQVFFFVFFFIFFKN